MREIEFSVMENAAGDAKHLRTLLDQFEKEQHIHVNLTGIPWSRGWSDISKFGIFGNGPDVSSIGSTWVGSLASMQALRPFTARDINVIGGADAFFKGNWQVGFLSNDPKQWAVPWLGDTQVLYYWKDAFERLGLGNAPVTFASDDALVETLQQLQAQGYPYPFFLTTQNNPVNLHEAAHWIWNAGGDFISPDQSQVFFNKPEALNGLRKYFSLSAFISPRSFDTHGAEEMFVNREAVIQAGGPWLGIIGRQLHPEWHAQLGIARLPGQSYTGGSHFVIWKYSPHPEESLALIKFLSSREISFPASPHDHQIPVRREALHVPVTENSLFNQIYLDALENGKAFPTMRLWGAVEDKLITGLANIWADRFNHPNEDLDECMHKHLDPIAKRLNNILAG